jgi:hypothetical protein
MRVSDSRGSVQSTYILLGALVALTGMVGLRAVGDATANAIGGDDNSASANIPRGSTSRAAPILSSSPSPSLTAQAGIGAVARLVDGAAGGAREFATLVPAPHIASPSHVPGRVFDADQVRFLRAAAHDAWTERASARWGRDSAVRRDATTGRPLVEIDGALVGITETPILSRPESTARAKVPARMQSGELRRWHGEQRTLMARLDEALDASFALGHTNSHATGYVDLLGSHEVKLRSFHRETFRPAGVWSMIVHGSPFKFERRHLVRATPTEAARTIAEDLRPADVAARLREAGYREGESVLLISCSAGACAARESAAQAVADALGGPVVAPSVVHFVDGENRALFTKDKHVSYAGEWRLFRPSAWDSFEAHKRVVLGREPLPGEHALPKVNDLWQLPGNSAERIELAGPWTHFSGENDSALLAASHALAPGGRLVLRTDLEGVPLEYLEKTLDHVGLRVAGVREGDITVVVARSRWGE